MKTAAALFTTMLFVACGEETPVEIQSSAESQAVSVLGLQTEIGLELGDSNYVFGVIQDLDFTSDGNLAVLDTGKKVVKVYSPQGEFLGVFGGAGEAPGEFLNPRGIACLSDGRIAVTDPFSGEVELFTGDLQYSETFTGFTSRAPFVITAAGNGFAGELGSMNRDAGIVTTTVSLWDLESDSSIMFSEVENSFSPEFILQRIMKPESAMCADEENIYYAAPATENYTVSVYPVDGSTPYELSYPDYAPVEKTAEDLEADIQAYEYRMQGMAAGGRGSRLAGITYNPTENYYATGSIGIDSLGNLWVQRGWEPDPTFDLFPPGATEPAETVTVNPELHLGDFTFVVTPHGIAAFNSNPEDFPRVLVLSLQ
ncbi:MAG: hypothetical protein J7K88_06975 [Candidatus Fermentibacteraceae bacterium]|nr:hypothetical protein [Candidatus Fermentibacteraceae bacterium]